MGINEDGYVKVYLGLEWRIEKEASNLEGYY